MDNREAKNNPHPPNCTCTACCTKRLKRLRQEVHPDYVSRCPRCGKKSLWHNVRENMYECLNLKCRAKGTSVQDIKAVPTWSELSAAANGEAHSSNHVNDKPVNSIGEDSTIASKVALPSKSVKLNNIVAEMFLRILAQVIGAILLTFALLRLGTWQNFISFPWLDGWPGFFIWFIPWEAFVGLFGFGFLIAGLFSNGLGKGMIAAMFSIIICLIIMFNTMPNFFQVVFWSGENGERMEESLKPDIMTFIVGGDGHRIWLHNNPNAKNPSWEELINFLRNDKTDQHPYVIGSFVCADFAEALHNNAEKAGIRAAYVIVNKDHALNAFNTTDKGLIYIDDGGLDTIAYLVIGDKYTIEPLWSEDQNRLASVTVNVGIVNDSQIDW